MKRVIYFLFISFFFGCNYNKEVKDNKVFNKSYKKQISSEDIDKNEIEYFDDSTRIYSNFKYGISFKETRGWEIDYGVGQYDIYRSSQKDSAYTFSINVIEVNVDPDEDMDIHKFVDIVGIEAYNSQLTNTMSKIANTEVIGLSSQKIYLRNYPAMRVVFSRNVKEGNDEIIFTNIFYQLMRKNFTITCSFSAPQFFYEKNKQDLNDIFRNIQLLNINKP